MSCNHKELVVLKAQVVDAIRRVMTRYGAVESYYNKITGGTGACLLPDTQITIHDGGSKSIQDIQEGDLVLTHRGRLRKVSKVMRREINEKIFDIKVTGSPYNLQITEEHPILARKIDKITKYRTEYVDQAQWELPTELQKNDVIHAPTYNPHNSTEDIDEQTSFVLGIYCAEGFLHGTEDPQEIWKTGQYYGNVPNWSLKTKPNNGYNVSFVLNKIKDSRLIAAIEEYAERLGIETIYRDCESSSKTIKVTLNHRPFAKLCKRHCGSGARTKRLSQQIMTASPTTQKAFIAGYLLGDGCILKAKNKISKKLHKKIEAGTASKQLAFQMYWMLERCGIISSLREVTVVGGPQYRDRRFKQWKIKISQTQSKKLENWLEEDFSGKDVRGSRFPSAACTYGKITSIKRKHYSGPVYNFEVEEDNSYVANFCTVHNCENVPTAFILANTPQLSFLSQTDQLLMESEILEYDLQGIWTLGRSYRNEPRTGDGRHLSEFALLEFEGKNMDLDALLAFQQDLLNAAIKVALRSDAVSDEYKEKLKEYLIKPATIITYTEVLNKLNEQGIEINWGDDFISTIEAKVCEMFSGPVQVTNYPESIKFFNMYRNDREELEELLPIEEYNNRRYTVDCVDVLLPLAGETFGASRREENYETLKMKLRESIMFKQMRSIRKEAIEKGTIVADMEHVDIDAWQPFVPYLELFNPEKHPDRKSFMRSGFGLGMGRLIQFLIGSENVVVF